MFDTERLTKQARISGPWDSNKHDIAPEIDVNAARQANDLRLKSRFEDIFEKYGRDFSSVGDEIDLATGKIIIDNGHIEKMRNEQDLGAQTWKYDFDPFGETELTAEYADEAPNAPNLKCAHQNGKHAGLEEIHLGNYMNFEFPSRTSSHNSDPPNGICTPFDGSLPCSDTLLGGPSDSDKRHPKTSSHPVGPLWQTPVVDERLFGSSPLPTPPPPIFPPNRSASPPNSGSLWALPQTRRKKTPRARGSKPRGARKIQLLPRTRGSNSISDSDSDDPLQNGLPPISTPSKVGISDEIENIADKPSPIAKALLGPLCPFSPLPDSGLNTNEANDEAPEDSISETSSLGRKNLKSQAYVESPLFQANSTIGNEVPTILEDNISLAEPESITQKCISTEPVKSSTGAGLFSPSEIKTILTLRAIQKRPWKEVYRSLPNRTPGQLRHWYSVRSTEIKKHMSTPISLTATENEMLKVFDLKPVVSWADLETTFQAQTRYELQCTWTKICLGEMLEDWKSSHGLHAQKPDGNFKTPPKPSKPLSASKSFSSSKKLSQTLQTTSPSRKPRTPSFVPTESSEQGDEGSDGDNPLSEAFGSAWSGSGLSTIQIDTPPKPRNTQKRHSLLKNQASPWANRTPKT
ncbi:hypothetical protein AJ78_05944 [Emergomyces pasteurianus Ep9510]|uniref:Myb-like domain-containing protein n=1 Tax=Emergomyces pasteurianus Ep9510 TaxID=1447872 RepID=A0A1J9PC44_9EURO|nr:hypothetical protein AJ78_05944 [Emergomyces pasteurianus Ep9510]